MSARRKPARSALVGSVPWALDVLSRGVEGAAPEDRAWPLELGAELVRRCIAGTWPIATPTHTTNPNRKTPRQ